MVRSKTLLTLAGLGLLLGATAGWAQFWEVGNDFVQTTSQPAANAGRAVAVGDFNGDGIDDWVIGAPYWDSGDGADVGSWRYIRGSATRAHSALGPTFYFTGADDGRGGFALAAGDFDGDGRDEVAIGRPYRDVATGGTTYVDAGTVLVQGYGATAWENLITLSQIGIPATGPEEGDRFGYRLATGNFNGDDYDDLVVGVPFEDWNTSVDSGVVHVYYGSASGLSNSVRDTFAAGAGGVLGTRTTSDRMGWALAAGDLDGDGYDDLAIGAPYRDVFSNGNAGEVHVLYGAATGVEIAGQQLINDEDVPDGAASPEDLFGAALAIADFNSGGVWCATHACFADLAIGVPGNTWTDLANVGKVVVAAGGAAGVAPASAKILSQDEQIGTPEAGDRFGYSLAAGHVDRLRTVRTYSDLVVSSPFEDWHATDDGYAHLFFGSATGIDGGLQEQGLHQSEGYECEPPADSDLFGHILALGDFDDDGWGDLLIGLPNEDAAGSNAGGVQILYGALFADGVESSTTGNW